MPVTSLRDLRFEGTGSRAKKGKTMKKLDSRSFIIVAKGLEFREIGWVEKKSILFIQTLTRTFFFCTLIIYYIVLNNQGGIIVVG